MNALEIRHLTKEYPGFRLDDLSLTLPGGCVLGLIGENGAGKSTTIRLILDIVRRDGGTVTVLGRDNRSEFRLTREEVGVVFDETGLPECLTAEQTGTFLSRMYRGWDAAEFARLTEKFALPPKKPLKDYSRGMRMKLGIAAALSHNARLLLLDEPTGGLDPVARDEVVEMLREFTRPEDHSILISSHIVSDLEKLCDYVAFLHQGKLILCGEKDRVCEEYAAVFCTPEELSALREDAVVYRRDTGFGCEAVVRRGNVPEGMKSRPVGIEELFLFMVKGAENA